MKSYAIQSRSRLIFLTIAFFNLCLIGIQLLRYPPLLKLPGALSYVIEPIILLFTYGIAIFWITKKRDSVSTTVLRIGTSLGLVCGVLEIVHLIQENFFDFGGNLNGVFSIGFMVGVFLLWGVASYRIVRITHSVTQGILASVWTAVVTILIAVFFGFMQEFYLHTPAPAYVATWGEFIRSGWKDIAAFTIANTLDSATTHLFTGPLVAVLVGSLAGVGTKWQHKIKLSMRK